MTTIHQFHLNTTHDYVLELILFLTLLSMAHKIKKHAVLSANMNVLQTGEKNFISSKSDGLPITENGTQK